MAMEFVASATDGWGYPSGGTDNADRPATTQSGDLWVVWHIANSSQASTALSGFTKKVTNITVTNIPYYLTVWTRKCDGTENASYTITGYSGDPGNSIFSGLWRSVPTTWDAYAKQDGPSDGTYTLTFPTATATYNGTLEILMCWSNSLGPYSSWSVGTERVDSTTHGIADRYDLSSGATGSSTVTTTVDQWGGSFGMRILFGEPSGIYVPGYYL